VVFFDFSFLAVKTSRKLKVQYETIYVTKYTNA